MDIEDDEDEGILGGKDEVVVEGMETTLLVVIETGRLRTEQGWEC